MTPALLMQIVAFVVQLGPVVLADFLKLEGILTLGPDEKQNVANAIASAASADADTIALVDAWKNEHGIV